MPVDVKALRELAEKATSGEWFVEEDGRWIAAVVTPFDGGDVICDPPSGADLSLNRWPENREFIAACSPSTVLALLDEIERKDKALDEIALRVSYIAQHGVSDEPYPAPEGGGPQIVPSSRAEFTKLFYEIGDIARAALSPETPDAK